MWLIVRNPREQLYTVGYYNPQGEWVAHRDFDSSEDAARFIHWLNGGDSREGFFEGDADLRRMVKSRRGQQEVRAAAAFALLAAAVAVLVYSENVAVCLLLVGLALVLVFTDYRR